MQRPPLTSSEHDTTRPAGSEPSDDAVLRALASGDVLALDVLVARFGARIKTYVARIVQNEEVAEDLAHDVFVRLVETSGSFRESAQPFIFRIARNVALDVFRQRQIRRRGLATLRSRTRECTESNPLRRLEDDELRVCYESALARLREVYRSAYLLRVVEGLTYEEIAAVVGATPKTVSTRIHRARAYLREQLADFINEEDVP